MIKLLSICVVWHFSYVAMALPKVEVEKINGFEVHFVDIGQGDSYGVTFAVPFGTMHDSNDMMGRAHLLEHVMHIGSKRFPGYHAFDQKLSKVGVNSNAYTSGNSTFYFASGTETHGETISEVMLSMLGGLEWNESYFASERDVVINEIAVESNKKDAQVSRLMGLTKLLPKEHPWNHALLGDGASLKKMSLNDLKEFYYQVYNPKHVKVAIFGNFSKAELKAKAKRWTHQHLKPADIRQDPHAYVLGTSPAPNQFVPSEFSLETQSPESEKVLYIESKVIKSREILFSADRSLFAKPQGIYLLADYLSLNVPGTWLYDLQTTKGWITSAYVNPVLFKNRIHFEIGFSLTDLGHQYRQEVTDAIFKALKSIQSGVPEDVLALLKESRIHELEKNGRSVRSYMVAYGQFLSDEDSYNRQIEEFKSTSSNDLANFAKKLTPGQALYIDVGPGFEDMKFDSVFERHFELFDNRRELTLYNKTLKSEISDEYVPQLKAFNLKPFAETREAVFIQSPSVQYLPERVALDLRKDLFDSAASVRFRLPAKEKRDMLIASLFWQAFFEKYRSELTYLKLKYQTSFTIDLESDFFVLKAFSEGRHAAPALEWLLATASTFVPDLDLLERTRESVFERSQSEFASAFTAALGFAELRAKIDPLYLSDAQTVLEAQSIDLKSVSRKWKDLIAKSDKQYVLVGDFALTQFERIRDTAAQLSPNFLSDEQVAELNSRYSTIRGRDQYFEQFPLTRSSNSSFAQVRIYLGPSVLDLKESAAFLALNALTSELVGNFNRGDQALGYVHTTSARILDGQHHYLSFLGGVEGVENTKLVVAGWEHVMTNLKNGVYTREKIRDAIESARNSLLEKKNSAEELVADYAAALNVRHDALGSQLLAGALLELQPEDILKVAQKYLLGEDKKFMQYTFGDCSQFLN